MGLLRGAPPSGLKSLHSSLIKTLVKEIPELMGEVRQKLESKEYIRDGPPYRKNRTRSQVD